ncbi:MAG: hypothetical protein K2M34_01300 [Alphaproteobacteria bacterium]|nr:hypothetical protein [Alphaproteobacteria bacterium]
MTNFFRFSVLLACLGVVGVADAAQSTNPRSGATVLGASRTDAVESRRGNTNNSATATSGDTVVSRSAVRRGGNTNAGRSGAIVPMASVTSRSATTKVRKAPAVSSATLSSQVRPSATAARSGINSVVRSATTHNASVARGATVGASRAGVARATSVFDDISKMGTGYATCRDAYATCMDQLCAKANDTYRRCFCSAKFAEFRDTEAALDEAKTLLMKFEDNSLNAVDKTAAEVNAMYSATVGEAAIKKDTSAAQKTLSEISELLSGKKKATPTNNSSSLGILSLDFTADVDDIWSGDADSSFFGGNSVDLSQLEGTELFNKANSQCLKIIADSCENNAVLNMAKSSYSILITQDCNAYEKKINTQREAVKSTARQAEKYLREARLEEYRAHNSADVNECVGKVKSAMLEETACGAGYKRCLDYSGAYVNPVSGEAIYSQRLFQLTNLITLDGQNADVLGQNAQFNKFLDDKRMFAKSALDTCRDMQDIVWTEFKRSALIEIAQAQDALIENVKSTCVSTMKSCYDTQTESLKSFDETTAQAAGALAAYASKAMCEEKVIACASLYGNTDGCTFDGNGKIVGGNTKDGTTRCGLTALLSFVDTVDTVRVAEGCSTAIDNYVKDLCTPTAGEMGFPWNCRKKAIGSTSDAASASATSSVAANIMQYAIDNCSDPTKTGGKTYANLPAQTKTQIEKAISNIQEQLEYQMMETCEALDGYWQDTGAEGKELAAFYTSAYGNAKTNADILSWGKCVENSTKVQCLSYNTEEEEPMARYDATRDECVFTNAWYESRCAMLGNGYFENGICYVKGK